MFSVVCVNQSRDIADAQVSNKSNPKIELVPHAVDVDGRFVPM